MVDYTCSYPSCIARSIPDGDCDICLKHHCADHDENDLHPCRTLSAERMHEAATLACERENVALRSILDKVNLVSFAERLHPGRQVSKNGNIDIEDLPQGSVNVHIPIQFDDGVRWIARIHQIGYRALPREIGRVMMQGEIDTLVWLRSVAEVPVAEVKSPIITSEATDYYFQEFIQGKPYGFDFHQDIPTTQLAQTISDLADIFIRISNHPLRGVGSLSRDPTTTEFGVGPYINYHPVSNEPPFYPGPFRTAGEKWATVFGNFLEAIRAKKLHRDQTALAFCVFSWILDAVLAYPPFNSETDTYVMHCDSKADMIMTDGDDGKITALIDWEAAAVSHPFGAFAAPLGLMSDDAIYEGGNELSPAETLLAEAFTTRGRLDLAECVQKGKTYQGLEWLASGGTAWTKYTQLVSTGESMGLVMPATMEEFESVLREKYRAELAHLVG